MKIKHITPLVVALACSQSALAEIKTLKVDKKNDLKEVMTGYSIVGEGESEKVETEGSEVPQIKTVQNDPEGGDGKSDGGVKINSMTTGGQFGAQMLLGKAGEKNGKLSLSTHVFNVNSSYVKYEVQFYNKTDKKVLATSGVKMLEPKKKVLDETIKLDYKLTKDDLGDEIFVRWVQLSTDSTARDIYVDNVSVVASEVEAKK